MRYVWRVQEKSGWGPYRKCDAIDLELYSDWEHPSPHDDETLMRTMERRKIKLYGGGWLFGFDTKEQALRWFGREMETLEERGYKLERVPAVEWAFGEKQMIFIPKEKPKWLDGAAYY